MENAKSCPTAKAACRFKSLGAVIALCLVFACTSYCLYRFHDLQNNLAKFQEQLVHQTELSAQFQHQLQSHQKALSTLQLDEKSWVLKETEYLIRLAQMRINFLQDVPTALSQLVAAEQRISELADPTLFAMQQRLAHDIGVLRAYHVVDVQGIWLRLSALNDSLETLPLVVTTQASEPQITEEIPASTVEAKTAAWRQALAQSWQEIKSMIKIRHHDEAMLTPILGIMDRQRLQQTVLSLVEQAKWAVLNRNATIYEQSLETLSKGLPLFLGITEQQLSALEAEIQALKQIDIAPSLPVLSTLLTQADAPDVQDVTR